MVKPSVPKKIGEKALLDLIRENQPISVYNLSKLLPYASYSGVHNYIMELEKKGKVKTELKVGENNRTERIVNIKNGKIENGK